MTEYVLRMAGGVLLVGLLSTVLGQLTKKTRRTKKKTHADAAVGFPDDGTRQRRRETSESPGKGGGNPARLMGVMGESVIRARLDEGLSKDRYAVLNNVYLPLAEGGTTQIDHVVVSPYGVFVVETKNFKGWIFGDAKAPTWTQVVFHKKNTFQNPIRQNYLHVCTIAENLGLPKECLKGIVVFAGDCEFKTPMPEGVVEAGRLTEYIKGFQEPVFDEAGVADIVGVLQEWDASVSRPQRCAHVANLRKRHRCGRDGKPGHGERGGAQST